MISNLIIRTRDLPASTKVLAITLKSFSPSFPSYRTLNKLTGFSSSTISKNLKILTERKILTYVRGSWLRQANEYTFLPEDQWLVKIEKSRPYRSTNERGTAFNLEVEPHLQSKHNNINLNKTNKKRLINNCYSNFSGAIKELKGLPLLEEYLQQISHGLQLSWIDQYRDVPRVRSTLFKCCQSMDSRVGKSSPTAIEDFLCLSLKMEFCNHDFSIPRQISRLIEGKSLEDAISMKSKVPVDEDSNETGDL